MPGCSLGKMLTLDVFATVWALDKHLAVEKSACVNVIGVHN